VKVLRTTSESSHELIMESFRLKRNDRAINDYLSRHGYRIDDESMGRLREAVAEAVLQAREHLLRLSEGDYRPDPDAERFPQLDLTAKQADPVVKKEMREDLGKYSLLQVFEDYAKERDPAPSTYKS